MNEPRSLPTQRAQLEGLAEQRLWLQVLIAMAAGIGVGVLKIAIPKLATTPSEGRRIKINRS